jgi:DNA invertase Pin-like site-specific DNA recombinase
MIPTNAPIAERVALYLRVSSEEQRDRETIEIQREFLEPYCELYGFEVVKTYADDGVSGTIPLHEWPEGRQLLEDAKEGKFQAVLVYRLDRLGRSLLVADDATDELETRREELGRRLAAKQTEKDRYVHLYTQGHISEAELETHLLDLKNQTENVRLLL